MAWVAASATSGLICAQICLATGWGIWSTERLPIRAARLVWNLAGLYLLILIAASFADPRHFALLWCLPLAMFCFVVGTWLAASPLRWFRFALVDTKRTELPFPQRLQFGLADAWRWCSMFCALLAVMVLFRNEVTGWDGILYAILVGFGIFMGVPLGLVVPLILWLMLGERWTRARWLVSGLLVAVWSTTAFLAVGHQFGESSDVAALWVAICVVTSVVYLVTFLTGYVLRRQGWRLKRLERSPGGN